jgi:response regulator RpfG family c-di-GMP phosphodiesterase
MLTQDAVFNSFLLSNVKILMVDNDRDCAALYAALFENYDVEVVTAESIKEALELLSHIVPDILICEARFLGESVYPLIQRVRSIAQKQYKVIPICVTSTYPAVYLAEHLKVTVEAYRAKPLDFNVFAADIWNLIILSKITQPFNIYSL